VSLRKVAQPSALSPFKRHSRTLAQIGAYRLVL
jgi:hypothetical protein